MLKPLGILLLIAYPGLVYFGITHLEPMYLTLIVIAALLLSRVVGPGTSPARFGGFPMLVPIGLYLIASLLSNEEWVVRLYPAVMSLSMLGLFGWSLWSPPTVIERIARLQDPDLSRQGVRYALVVTWVWVVFLFINTAIASWTAVRATREMWALYNGVISYVCIGVLFAIEYPIRVWYRARHATR